MNIDQVAVEAIATAVAAKLRQPVNEPLWTIADVARYLGYKERVVREKKMLERGFPAPIRLPALRWKPDDIRAYAEARQG